MQNTVEQKALTLSSTVFLNSTTKFVKGVSPPVSSPGSQALLTATISPKAHKGNTAAVIGSSLVLPVSPNKAVGTVARNVGLLSPAKVEEKALSGPIEMAAFNLSASVFMNSTTKFVKGFADLTPVRQKNSRSPKEKKSLSQGKKKEQSVKKNTDPEASSKVRTLKTPEKNAMDMAAANYMNSTTKYMKTNLEPNANNKVQKIVRSTTTAAQNSNQKLGNILGRDKSQASRPRADSPHSDSSSGGRIARKKDKDRTRELKFIERREPEQSVVTVKDRTSSLDFKTRRNDTKIVQAQSPHQPEKDASKGGISQLILNSQHYALNEAKLPSTNSTTSISQFDSKPNRLSRNTLNEAKSADARPTDKKEETGKPFARQPQNTRPQLIPKVNEAPKVTNTLPSGQLPLETPIKQKIQSAKQIDHETLAVRGKPQTGTQHQISVIRQERSSVVQHTKTTITNKKSAYGSTKEDIASPPQTQIEPSRHNQTSKIVKTELSQGPSSREQTQSNFAAYGVVKSVSSKLIKPEETEKAQETIAPEPNRQLLRSQQRIQSKKDIKADPKTTASTTIQNGKTVGNRLRQTQIKKAIKTQSDEFGSKTSIEELSPETVRGKKVQNANINPTHPVLQNKKSLPSHLEQTKPQQPAPSKPRIDDKNTNKDVKSIKSTRIVQTKAEQTQPKEKEVAKNLTNQATQQANSQKEPMPIQSPKPVIPLAQIRQMEAKQQRTIPKEGNIQPSLKQSLVISQLCSKLYYRLLSHAFSRISSQSQTSHLHSKEALILSLQTANSYVSIQKSTLAEFFGYIKRASALKMPLKKEVKASIGKESASSIIFRAIQSKQREYFQTLKRNKTFALSQAIQTKEKIPTQTIQKEVQSYLLQQLKKIAQSVSLSKVKTSFGKILLYSSRQQKKTIIQVLPPQTRSPAKYTRPTRDYQTQKTALFQAKSQIQTSISAYESRIAEKKRYSDLQKTRMLKKQQEMTQKNRKFQEDLALKKKVNKQLKGQVQTMAQKEDLDISLPDYQPLIGLLTDIYSTVFASKEEKVDAGLLASKYDLAKEDRNSLLDQWSSLARNAQLKAQISKWEGADPFTSCQERPRRDNEVLGSLMRNLIRERYLWQWVRNGGERR